ncbi:histidine phosphatase family protein [Paenibacillus barengoltzii]|uniref:histidine phosphatase family protein n=1 Tax=Paenibacillus barengoltzii TaxID=343517 RepID=UPI003F8B1A57
MIYQRNMVTTWNHKQLAFYHFTQAGIFERLKMASANDPVLYYHYAEQQFANMALAYRYKAMTDRKMNTYTTDVGGKGQQKQVVSLNRSLLNSLQGGGYILYSRHGEATVGVDQPNLNFQDCTTQRNLSDEGRRQAVVYGETFRRLRIPFMFPVQASPFCRTIETAALAFGKENVQVDPFGYDIYKLSGNISHAEQTRILNSLRFVLETQPPIGSNMVIIAHSFPTGVGLGQIPNMGTVVVKPSGRGNGYEVVTKVSLEELSSLGE